jgi:holo-[acyl-carrier protein] synthase
MIIGVGIDIVEVPRVQRLYDKFGQRFLTKILRQTETDYCLSCAVPPHAIAGRFAAKEAVAKAFGTGIGTVMGWHDIEITRAESGAPVVTLYGKGRALAEARAVKKVHISLTHTQGYAVAVAIIEG